MLLPSNRHAHTFLDHDSKHQRCGSCVVGLSVIMMSMIKNMKCEHGVINRCVSCQQLLPSGFLRVYKSVVPFSYSSTNKAFQVTEDPPCLKPFLNGKHELLASFDIFPCLKLCVQTRIYPINLEFLDPVVQCLINLLQSAVAELVDLIEAHDHPNLEKDITPKDRKQSQK
ncbi:hypothetical protein Tco_0942580 [Tanacetum coccineum]